MLACQVLTEVGTLEKIGSPQPVDGEGATAPGTNGSAQASTSINPYAQQPQQQQQVQQPRPSQYDSSLQKLTIVAILPFIPSKAYLRIRTSNTLSSTS